MVDFLGPWGRGMNSTIAMGTPWTVALVVAMARLMAEIDEVIPSWPIEQAVQTSEVWATLGPRDQGRNPEHITQGRGKRRA